LTFRIAQSIGALTTVLSRSTLARSSADRACPSFASASLRCADSTAICCCAPARAARAGATQGLIVDGRLAEGDAGPAEVVATRLTRLLSDSLAALAEKKNGAQSG
jgi:hypothetical protein